MVPALWAARALGKRRRAGGRRRARSSRVALFRAGPRLIVVVALASAAVALLALPVDDDRIPASARCRAGCRTPSLAACQPGAADRTAAVGVGIAFLAGVESLLSAMVADRMIGGSHRSNAELLAQGGANIVSPLFGGLPATGAIARTATNVRAGGRTPVAGMVHALVILLVVVAAAPLAGYLAMPALAALLLITAWYMSEPHRWRERLSARLADRFLLFLTMILTVASNLTVAIAVGTVIGLAMRLARRGTPPADWSPDER